MAKGEKGSGKAEPTIVIKNIKKVAGGHHGGAWKVAYADFVTAMMAFFLLLWLLNVSTDEARQIISSYFDPAHPRIADSRSGAGGVMGGLSVSKEGAQVTDVQPISNPVATGSLVKEPKKGEKGEEEKKDDRAAELDEQALERLEEELRRQEKERFEQAAAELKKMIEENAALKQLAENLLIDITPEGLRIQIVDQKGRPMFPSGSANMYDYTRKLIDQVAIVANTLPNDISIRGHTDSHKYAPGAAYTNWELSADRANASRRGLVSSGIDKGRIADVMGKADRDPLDKSDPFAPQNRRISILMLRETVEHALERGGLDGMKNRPESKTKVPVRPSDNDLPRAGDKPLGTFQRTPGEVYFP